MALYLTFKIFNNMVQKPPVDIEWYDDGFSIEEQSLLKKEYEKRQSANKIKIQVTEQYHDKTKDKIISELRQKLAASEEYIKELEENNVLKSKYDTLKKQYNNLQQKYTSHLNNPELINQQLLDKIEKYKDIIKDLESRNGRLSKYRDELINKLYNPK